MGAIHSTNIPHDTVHIFICVACKFSVFLAMAFVQKSPMVMPESVPFVAFNSEMV